MLTIRKEQMEILGRANRELVPVLMPHIKEFFPAPYRILGEEVVGDIIQFGKSQAERYGINTIRGVCMYVDAMFMLGSYFDEDFQLPWVQKFLKAEGEDPPIGLIGPFYDYAIDYQDRVAGLNDGQLHEALLRFLENPPERVANGSILGILDTCQQLYPQKYEVLGDLAMHRLAQLGIATARQYQIASKSGNYLFCALMFLYGSSFDQDLQFPWATEILNDETIESSQTKIAQLYKAAIEYGKELLA